MAQLAPGTAGIGFPERAIAGSNVLSTITKAKRSHTTAMLCFQLFPLLRCLSWCQAWREVPSTEAVLDFNAVLSLSCLLGRHGSWGAAFARSWRMNALPFCFLPPIPWSLSAFRREQP